MYAAHFSVLLLNVASVESHLLKILEISRKLKTNKLLVSMGII